MLCEGGGSGWAVAYFLIMVLLSRTILASLWQLYRHIWIWCSLANDAIALDAVEGEEVPHEMRSDLDNPDRLKQIQEKVADDSSYNPFESLQEGVKRMDWLITNSRPLGQAPSEIDEFVEAEKAATVAWEEAMARAQEKADAETVATSMSSSDCPVLHEVDLAKFRLEAANELARKAQVWDHIRWTVGPKTSN